MSMLMFIVSGLLGGVASALLWAKSWQDLKKYDVFRAVVLGAIGGYLYWLIHTEWGAPDTVAAFFVGYSFKDIIEALAEKVNQMHLAQRKEH